MTLQQFALQILLLIPLLHGCYYSAVRMYDLVPVDGGYGGGRREFSDGTLIQTYLTGTKRQTSSDSYLVREPYQSTIQIKGNIQRINSIEGWLLLNGTQKIFLPQSAEEVNATRQELYDGRTYFEAGGKAFSVTDRWESIRSLELELHITATTDAGTEQYDLQVSYEKVKNTEGVSVFDAMMSI